MAIDAHWQQVCLSGKLTHETCLLLRVAAGIAFLHSLTLCNLADHATIASLVWVMALTAGALLVAFTLTWRPRLLRVLWPMGGHGTRST